MSTVAERVADAVAPAIERLGLLLHDVEYTGTSLRVLVDRDGGPESGGIDVDALTDATRAVSKVLDELDPIAVHYTLEVSSPGLERPLRTAAHFRRAVDTEVTVKTLPGVEGERRFTGVVAEADDDAVTVRLDDGTTRVLRYGEIERARTTFAWGPGPKPGKKAPQP
jgi:ribosome maturation factor RimP